MSPKNPFENINSLEEQRRKRAQEAEKRGDLVIKHDQEVSNLVALLKATTSLDLSLPVRVEKQLIIIDQELEIADVKKDTDEIRQKYEHMKERLLREMDEYHKRIENTL